MFSAQRVEKRRLIRKTRNQSAIPTQILETLELSNGRMTQWSLLAF
uniref:Uncharacterized protein n=1 Tax=Manihot esculenta TaxID=3983 RepID=A0A199U990_MANES